MGWGDILKKDLTDIRLIDYIMRDGEFRTAEAIMDKIYDFIAENRKLGMSKLGRMKGRPSATRFGMSRELMKRYMTTSPDYKSRDTGYKTPKGRGNQPIKEYRYF